MLLEHTSCPAFRTTVSRAAQKLRSRNGEKVTAGPLLLLVLCWGVLATGAVPAAAQPLSFGSADDPREPGRRAPWEAERYVGLWGGPSLVGPQWRGHLTGVAVYIGPSYAARLEGTLRGGVDGSYEEDTDEAYDLLRLVDFARYVHTTRREGGPELYARLGPLQQLTLGPAGHLVHFFRSNTAYDERTVGAEALVQTPLFSFSAFTDNVLLDGVTGARLDARPFAGASRAALASAEAGITAVTDLGLLGNRYDDLAPPTALALDARYDAIGRGGVGLTPFASAAALLDYGWGLGAGAAFATDDLGNLLRFALRLEGFYSSRQFTPGVFGPFYMINNPRARLARGDAASQEAPGERSAAVPLTDIEASGGWKLSLRLLFFERFELASSYYGHLGDQDLSRYHLRLFFRSRGGTRLYLRLDRAGLDHVFSLFQAADDQTAITFNADYRLPFDLGPAGVWAHLRTRYTFERLANDAADVQRFLPVRWFEPSVGVRLQL